MIQNIKENWGLYAAAIGLPASLAGWMNAINGVVACTLGIGALILVIYKIRLRHIKYKFWVRQYEQSGRTRPHKKKLPDTVDIEEDSSL